jgi:flagellin-like protein
VVHFAKKGISPFISVILLVALTVTIAVFVINWSDLLTRETAETIEEKITQETVCNINVGFDVLRDLQGYRRICLNTTSEHLEVVFENKGSVKIEDIHASVLLNDASISEEVDIDIVPGGIRVASIEINVSSPSEIQQAVFTPAVRIREENYWCTDSKLALEGSSIGSC